MTRNLTVAALQLPLAGSEAENIDAVSDLVAQAAAQGASALLVVTEWREFRSPDFQALKAIMKTPLLLDGRNLYDPTQMQALGFEHVGIGRAQALAQTTHVPMPVQAWAA